MAFRDRMCRVLAIGLVIVAATTQGVLAAEERVGEAQVKAAFLLNVVKFVQWPPADLPSDTVVIGLVTRDSFRRAMEGVASGKAINGRPVVVREVRNDDEARGCHVLFFDEGSDAARRSGILRYARETSALTVGETPKFLSDGGLVRVYVEGDRLRFQIDPVGVQLSGLKVSAQLMSMAK